MSKSKHRPASEINFPDVVAALLDENTPFPPVYTYRLSNLDSNEVQQLKEAWLNIPLARRRSLLSDIENFWEADQLLDFSEVCLVSLRDPDPEVRILAIQAMWEEDTVRYARQLLALLEREKNTEVRAAGMAALGSYVYRGEIEEIPQTLYSDIETLLFKTLNGTETPLIRRRALESLGYSSNPEVDQYIRSAFQRDEEDWIATALVAMGRSSNKVWNKDVQRMLKNENPLLREEAARAAGGLELKAAAPELIKLLADEDPNVRAAAIWSLSLIGGKGVAEALEDLLEASEDEEEIELIEDALENLSFTDEIDGFVLMNFNEKDFSDSMYEFDPDAEEWEEDEE